MAEARRPRLRRCATRPAVWDTHAHSRSPARILTLALTLFACADPPSPAGAGSPCAVFPTTPCLDGLVCLDGRCLPRGELPAPATVGLPPTVSFDVPAPPAADADASDEFDASADSNPPTDDSIDVVPDSAAPDTTTPPELVLVGAFDDGLPSNMQLLLERGQAAVTEVFVPVAGRPELVRAHVQAPPLASGATTCARYRAVLWSPRALDQGDPGDPGDGRASFDLQPDLVGPEVLVPVPAGARLALDLPLVGPDPSSPPPPAAVALHRVGARYEGPCAGAQHVPWIQLDASGDNSQSFIWAETWIPGPDLQLPGRWGLLLGLAPAP